MHMQTSERVHHVRDRVDPNGVIEGIGMLIEKSWRAMHAKGHKQVTYYFFCTVPLGCSVPQVEPRSSQSSG